jgi:hypothetical protein
LLVCLLLAAPVAGQEGAAGEPPELVTDRPDQTESAETVPSGFVQVETGWVFARGDADGVRVQAHQAPGTLVRIGALDWMEIRAGWGGYEREEVGLGPAKTEVDGASDAELGAKFVLHRESGWRPQAALLAGVSLPVGDDAFSSERADPSFRFSLAHTLSDRFALGYNVGMAWETSLESSGDRDTLSNYLYTLALGIGLTERLGTFAEVFGEVGASADGSPAHSFDGGFTYLVRPNVQLDLSGGVGLSAAADDWFVGAGVSFRFPE